MKRAIILGTRGSELALTQARMVEAALRARWPEAKIEIQIIRTTGDEGRDPVSLGPAGRKGLFTAEIERSLIAGTIDVAVHSAKDLPSEHGSGTKISAVLPRASDNDVLVSLNGYDFQSLPRAVTVATGSVRRQHQIRWKRPDLQIVDLRGNVPTRLRKLIGEKWDGIVLARAGLERLNLKANEQNIEFEGSSLVAAVLPRNIFVPAGGQGIIALQTRADDEETRTLVEPIDDKVTHACLRAEREFLRLLQGDCNQPVGVNAIVNGNAMTVRGQVFQSELAVPLEAEVTGDSDDAEELGAELMQKIHGH